MDELLDYAPCGFLVFEDDGKITAVNKTLCTLLDYTQAELTDMRFESLLTVAGRIFYQTHFFPLISLHHKAEEIFLTLLKKDKAELPVLVNASRRTGAVKTDNQCILVPVHQRKKFEAELLQAKRTAEDALHKNEHLLQATRELEAHKLELDRQLGKLRALHEDLIQFSNVISHDVQEPIRKIAMFADIIQRENTADTSPVTEMAVGKIKYSSHRVRDMVSCIQQYVSVDTQGNSRNNCDLNKIITIARLKAMGDTGVHDIELSSDVLPEIEGYAYQLELLFCHLITNSILFRKDGEKTQIHIKGDIIQENVYSATEGKYRYADYLRIVFTDKGSGFDSKHGDYIFQLFKKAHVATEGLGFGLALCKKIVSNHYGSIVAKSQLGAGATFTILLPVRDTGI